MNPNCPLCSHELNRSACDVCPLGSNCPMVCCPACGYATIDTDKTAIGKLALSFNPDQAKTQIREKLLTLAEVPSGAAVRVVTVETANGPRPVRLQAYGLAPGRHVEVLQQDPVTVVRADHTELALEDELADKVLVELISE